MINARDELAALIGRHAAADGINPTPIPRLSLIRDSHPTEPLHALHEPALCIVARGRKRVLLGKEAYLYGPEQYLVVSVDLPVVGQVVDATLEKPYLCFRLNLDAAILGELLSEAGLDAAPGKEPGRGLALSPADGGLLDAAVRLARLLDAPRDAGVLAPLAEREILYRLLTGEQAGLVRRIALSDGRLGQVRRAIAWIKEHYRGPFSVEEVASEARMGTSALHHHFKAVTNMSPLQYQKRLRLQEARRLILGSSVDAASAGFNVGYGSPSQFSREYGRLFGAPPMRDAERLKNSHLQEA